MPSVDVDGLSLYYEEKGTGEPMVFSHGIPTDHRAWGHQMEALSKSYKTISYSRRYAAPNKTEGDLTDSTVGNNAADLKGFIERLEIGPVHLVGHSYGGFIAAFLAAGHPDLVRSLVLVEPAVSTLLVEDESSRAQMFSLLLRSPSVALSARRFQKSSLNPSLKALDAGQAEKAVELNVDGVQDKLGAFASMPEAVKGMMVDNAKTIGELRTKFPPFKAHVSKITCKTLVINGEESALWLRRIGEVFAASVPHGEGVKVPHARHFPHLENAFEFNERILGFLSKNG
jgi:pimeloyl-ACP methyl ester carboxylesterase